MCRSNCSRSNYPILLSLKIFKYRFFFLSSSSINFSAITDFFLDKGHRLFFCCKSFWRVSSYCLYFSINNSEFCSNTLILSWLNHQCQFSYGCSTHSFTCYLIDFLRILGRLYEMHTSGFTIGLRSCSYDFSFSAEVVYCSNLSLTNFILSCRLTLGLITVCKSKVANYFYELDFNFFYLCDYGNS